MSRAKVRITFSKNDEPIELELVLRPGFTDDELRSEIYRVTSEAELGLMIESLDTVRRRIEQSWR